MNKRQMQIEALATRLGSSKRDAKDILLTVTEVLKESLQIHGEAVLPNIGRLKVVDRAARPGRNPRTGEQITIPARQVVRFKVSTKF